MQACLRGFHVLNLMPLLLVTAAPCSPQPWSFLLMYTTCPHFLQVFLISKAGTHGINLVSCRRIVVLEEFFNPVYNLQAIAGARGWGRGEPVGLRRCATVRRPCCWCVGVCGREQERSVRLHASPTAPAADPCPPVPVRADPGDVCVPHVPQRLHPCGSGMC